MAKINKTYPQQETSSSVAKEQLCEYGSQTVRPKPRKAAATVQEEAAKNKEYILNGLAEALRELKDIRAGKVEASSAWDFLEELKREEAEE